MSAVVRNVPANPPGAVGAIMQTYYHMKPLIDQVKPILENKHVQHVALVAVGYIGTKTREIGIWVGLLSSSNKRENPILDKFQEIFPDLNTTNTTAVTEKIQELADQVNKIKKLETDKESPVQIYNVVKKQTNEEKLHTDIRKLEQEQLNCINERDKYVNELISCRKREDCIRTRESCIKEREDCINERDNYGNKLLSYAMQSNAGKYCIKERENCIKERDNCIKEKDNYGNQLINEWRKDCIPIRDNCIKERESCIEEKRNKYNNELLHYAAQNNAEKYCIQERDNCIWERENCIKERDNYGNELYKEYAMQSNTGKY